MDIAPAAAAAAARPAATAEPRLGPVQSGVAAGLRAVGAGYAAQSDHAAAVVDEALIYPVESVQAAGSVYKGLTRNVPVVKKTGVAFTVLGYLAAVQNLIATNLLRAPAEAVHDFTHKAADAIDGKKSFDGKIGILLLPPDEPAHDAVRGGLAAQ